MNLNPILIGMHKAGYPIFTPSRLFEGSSANDGGLYYPNPLQYQTVGSPWSPAEDPADPVGLILSRLGDGRGVVNILLNTATLSTQNVTTLAQDYTLFFSGAGTVELSGTATLAASPAGTYTFTATAGTLTVTVSGTVTNAQINAGATALPYQQNTYTVGGPGIHMSQATAGSRVADASVPVGAIKNRLVSTENFSATAWSKVGTASVTGTNVINLPAENDYVRQTLLSSAVAVNDSSIGGVELSGTGTVTILIVRAGGGTFEQSAQQVTLTSEPTLYTVSHTFANAQTGVDFRIFRTAGDTATSVTANKARANLGASLLHYQNVTSVNLITEAGKPSIDCYRMDSDWMTYGTGAFGSATAGFRASAADNWTVWLAWSTFGNNFSLMAQTNQGTSANRMFQVLIEPSGTVSSVLAGDTDTIAANTNNGAWHFLSLRCTAGVVQSRYNRTAVEARDTGAATAEAVDITAWARNASSPSAIFTGWGTAPEFIDRALSDTEWDQLTNYYCSLLGIS